MLGGLHEAPSAGAEYTPLVQGRLVRQKIERTNDYQQAGERYRAFEEWERDELILKLVNTCTNSLRLFASLRLCVVRPRRCVRNRASLLVHVAHKH